MWVCSTYKLVADHLCKADPFLYHTLKRLRIIYLFTCVYEDHILICVCTCIYVFVYACVYTQVYKYVYILIYKFIYAHILFIIKDEDRMSIVKDCALYLVLWCWNILQEGGSISVHDGAVTDLRGAQLSRLMIHRWSGLFLFQFQKIWIMFIFL